MRFSKYVVTALLVVFMEMGQHSAAWATAQDGTDAPSEKPRIGAYFFNDWHLYPQRMKDDFPEREPIWGYEEGTTANMEYQIKLAADAGLAFWAFCWYAPKEPPQNWRGHAGLTYANHPLNEALRLYLECEDKKGLDFCLLIANHGPYAIVPDQWDTVAPAWIELMKEKSYLRANGQPLLIFFSGEDMLAQFGGPEPLRAAFDQLRADAKAAGLPGVRIAVNSHEPDPEFEAAGFDAYTGYHFRWMVNPGWGRRGDVTEMLAAHERTWNSYPRAETELPVMPNLAVGWDDRPRYREEGDSPFFWWYDAPTPEQVYDHVNDMVDWIERHPDHVFDEQLGVIYAWNEIGEGGYLVPTKGRGGAFLQAVGAALSGIRKPELDESGFATVSLPEDIALDVPGDWLRIYGGSDGPASELPVWELDHSLTAPPDHGQKTLFRFVAPRESGFALVDVAAIAGAAPTGAAFREELAERMTKENRRLIEFLKPQNSMLGEQPCTVFHYTIPTGRGDADCRVVQVGFGDWHLHVRFLLSQEADDALRDSFSRMIESLRRQ